MGVNSPFYAEFFNPQFATAGLIPGEVWKTIKLGKSSYINTAPFSNYPPLYNTNGYHGYLAFNFANPGINWDVSLSTNTITSGQFDFYTNVLHEAMHMLGLASYITSNGTSVFGANKSYYSYYDAFLRNASNIPLISNGASSCSKYYHAFNTSANVSNLASCVGCATTCSNTYTIDVTNCSSANKYAGGTYTVPIYTPACFESGASLSHFEDLCYAPAGFQNNLYFVMTNGVPTGSGSRKRYPKAEERAALCDIGYNVNGVYNSTVSSAFYNYSVTACPGKDIAGLNDGLNSANVVTLVCTVNSSIQVSGINLNDRNAIGGYDCLETLIPSSGILSNTSGGPSTPFTYTPNTTGLHVLRYLPKNNLNEQGNITYVFIYALPNYTCNNSCNQVFGGNFESGVTPPIESYINFACGWENANAGTCDYYSVASGPSSPVFIPCNWVGYEPNSVSGGSAYAGFISFYHPNPQQSNNEILFSKLTSPLLPNKAYKLTFDISNGENRSAEAYSLQAYFSPDLSFLSNNTWNVNISNPSMLFTTPTSFTTTNGWQQAVINFTTGAVTNSEQYIVIGNLQNKPGISKTPSPANTGTCVYGSVTNGAYYYIDNVTLTTNSVTAIFNLPTGICTTQSVALNSLVSPSGGTFSGPYITNNAGNWSFNAASTATIGSFSIAYNYTVNGCAYTIFKQIQVGSTHTVTATSNTNIICSNLSQNTATLTANSTTTGVNWLWQPNASTVNPVVVSPTATTIYTVTGNNQGCQRSATVAVKVQTACCTTSLTPYSGPTALSGNTLNTSMAFNYDIDVVSPSVVFIQSSEFQFAPGVKITVKPSGILYINGAHLYGCGTDLWQGIVVEDGGQLKVFTNPTLTPKDNFIEDAQIAIDIQTQATTGYTAYGGLLGVTNTIFNKNFIGISIDNYVRNVSPYPFEIHNNVFTSRTLTFTPTSWPTCSVTAGSLRAATNPTAGLIAPNPLAGSLAYLKNPYNSQPGHIGIRLTSVGSSTGTVQYAIQIGRTANVNDYNIFDNLGQCIEATNSNVFSVNNVFQNTQQYTFDPPGPNPPYTFGGNGIRHVTNNFSFNSKLDLWSTSTNMSLGNRFYDCQYAINCDKTFLLNVRYCTFRSTKTTSATATGSIGVISRTNRFHHTISNNNIANIHTPINIALAPDTYTYNGNSGYGINAQNLSIQNNFIGAQTTTAAAVTNQFVNQAITLSAPTDSVYQVTLNSFAVTTNTIDRVFRGIEINNFGKNNFTANTSTNTIKLGDDNVFTLPQYGIRYTDNYIGTLRNNTLSATGITNTLITLFYTGNSVANPTVICNNLKSSYQGFEFNSNNSNVYWRGNFMDTHQRGLVLSNNGIIGTQGSSGNPIDNQYTGSWTGRNCTWTSDAATFASNSPMWIKNIGVLPYAPINNSGIPNPQSYGSGWISNTTGTFTGCGGSGGGGGGGASATTMLSSTSIQSNTLTDGVKYIQDFGNYQTSLTYTSSNLSNQSIININGTNSIDQFLKVDGMYYSGNLLNAKALNSSITCTNNVESIYKTYYNLYDRFITNSFTESDNNALSYIAELCPGTNGTAVYKARALYNYINQTARVYFDNCGKVYSAAKENNDIVSEISSINKLEINLFPNPAQNFVTLYSNQLNENLAIVITDIGGKVIQKGTIVTKEHLATIDLKIQNGMYLVTITNSNNDKIVKKLIISK